jgi:Spy/CpxP family protein refolding chaperone
MAFAQVPAPGATPQPGQKSGRMLRGAVRRQFIQQLNLTDAQKQQAKAIFQQSRQSAQPIAQQLKQNRESLAAAVKADDTAQIQALANSQGTLRGQMVAIRAGAMAKFYSILTPDQRTKADQMHQKLQQRFQQRMGQHTNG